MLRSRIPPETPEPGRWERRHYRLAIVVRALLAPWIVFVTIVLYLSGRRWGLVFLPFAGLDLWLLRHLLRYARARRR